MGEIIARSATGFDPASLERYRVPLSGDQPLRGTVLDIWREYGVDVTGGPIDCGHYLPEEAPEETYDWFMKFFPT